MKSIIAQRYGGPEVLAVVEDEIPEPAQRQARVKVLAAGAAFGDLLWMSGVVPGGPRPPYTPGYDFVGVVDKLGDGVSGLEVGQRVASLDRTGGFVEYVCRPQAELVPVMDRLDPLRIASMNLNYTTAWCLVTRVRKLSSGMRVLVHGAAGGMGTAMLDVCRMLGIRAWGTASSAKHDLVKSLGGLPIDYKSQDFVEEIRREGGVDLVVDPIGGDHLARSFKCLRPGGMLVSTSGYNAALGRSGRLETLAGLLRLLWWNYAPNGRSAFLFDITPYYRQHPGAYAEDLLALLDHLSAGRIDPVLDATYPLDEARQALEYVRQGKTRGKVVLVTEACQNRE